MRTIAFLLVAASAFAEVRGTTFTSPEKGVRFQVPGKGFTLRDKEFVYKMEDTIAEFDGSNDDIGGVLVYKRESWKAERHAKWRGDRWAAANAAVTWEREEKLDRKPGSWLVVEFAIESSTNDYHYAHLFVANKHDNFELMVWCAETLWEDHKKTILGILETLELGTFEASAEPEKEPVKEPEKEPGGGTAEREEGEKWSDDGAGVSLTAQPGWTVRKADLQFGDANALVEVVDGEDLLAYLAVVTAGLDPKTYSDTFVEKFSESFENLEELKSREVKGCVRRDFTCDREGLNLRFATLFALVGTQNYYLVLWCEQKNWDKYSDGIEAFLASLTFRNGTSLTGEKAPEKDPPPGGGVPAGGGSDEGGREVTLPNPWKGCAKGSWVKYRMISEAGGTTTEMEMTYVLIDQDDSSYTMRTDMVIAGNAMEGQPTTVQLKQKVKEGAEGPKPEEGEEAVTVAKGEYKCRWVKTTLAQGWSQTWSSDEVPFGMVKMKSEMSGSKTAMELVDFEKK